MTGLVEFLLARITEDEGVARCASDGGNATWVEQSSGVLITGEWPDGAHALGDSRLTRHFERWDPTRVLAECEAKRQIVALHSRAHHCDGGPDDTGWVHEFETCPTLRRLALPYAEHPDYRACAGER